MCGRYALHANPEVVALQFALEGAPEFKASYNVCPGTDIMVVRLDGQKKRVARQHRWGLGNKLANARGESLAERPAFRDAFRRYRCLVPASGFYEWQSVAGRKQPYYIQPAGDELFGLAGITELWNDLRTVSLVTTEPNALMRGIHDRMPVILAPRDYAAWLDPLNRDAERLKEFIRPYPADLMRAHPVSKAVSNAANEGAGLIERI